MSARSLMILGTASHVGKSIVTAALGRIFSDAGYRVAPFKAQNMSLNSAATPDGREIGRAQALQAEACRVTARVEMNPILLKPSSDSASQVVVLGRVWGQVSASDYHLRRVDELFPTAIDAYRALAAEHDIVLLEGAGSPAEINLKARDIVNLRMAQAAGARCILVGDIDRGGVFASLLGTVELLDPCERAMLGAFIVNKFRGDVRLLEPGIHAIAQRIQLPCAGVVPHLADLGLEEEDSVALADRPASRDWNGAGADRSLRIAVLKFPFLANFTDFDALAAEPSIALAFIDSPIDLHKADVVILPGSKQTLDDLRWLRERGFESPIREFRCGVIGICGGMQMLGDAVEDPDGAENRGIARCESGLGILPIRTVLQAEKITQRARGRVCRSTILGQTLANAEFHGYEIHIGETIYSPDAQPFAEISREVEKVPRRDGAIARDGMAFGTYMHGIFADDAFRHSFIQAARASCGLAPAKQLAFVAADRERRIDRLANHVREALDMNLIFEMLGLR